MTYAALSGFDMLSHRALRKSYLSETSHLTAQMRSISAILWYNGLAVVLNRSFLEVEACVMQTQLTHPQVHIGQIIRNAIVFNFKNWQKESMNVDALLQTVADLFALLEERKIDYVLVSGIALLQYIEGRNTEDIDLIMALSSLKKMPEIKLTSQDANFARGLFHDLQIDLLLSRNALFEKVRRQYVTTQPFAEQTIPCATVDGLLLLKLYALPSLYRQGNFARVGIYENDVATLLHAYHPPLEPLFKELMPHLSETDLIALRDIVADIQRRIERFSKNFGESA